MFEQRLDIFVKDIPSCNCGVSGYHLQPSEFNRGLRRYHLPRDHQCEFCPQLGQGLLEEGIHIMARLNELRSSYSLIKHYHWFKNRYPNLCQHTIKKALKGMTGLLKMGGRYISPHWKVLTYWETMFGYIPYGDLMEMAEDTKEWLVRTKHIGAAVGEEHYLTDLYNETVSYLREEWVMPRTLPTLEQWVQGGVWMRGKSGTGQKAYIVVEGKKKRSRSYKGVDAALKSDQQIVHELLSTQTERMVVMQKSEGGKIRACVKTGNELYRKMDFLSEIIEVGLEGSRSSTLFAGPLGNEEIDEGWLKSVKDTRTLKVPLDQSSFDHNQSKASIIAVLAAIGDTCFSASNTPQQYKDVWKQLWNTMVNKQVRVELDKKVWSWGNGIPSGWRWTALLDTLLNISSFRVIQKYVSRDWDDPMPVINHCAQGDDVIFETTELRHVERTVAVYSALGYEVHPQKTYISRDRGEFLRRSYEPTGITGYTCRTQLSMRFRNPVIELPLAPAERIASRVALWLLSRQRGSCAKGVADMIIEDAAQAGVSKEDVINFSLTPTCVGGLGLVGGDDCVASALLAQLETKSRWITPRIERPSLRLRPYLGYWKGRFERLGLSLHGDYETNFHTMIAQTWGLRQSEITGKVSVSWQEVERFDPVPLTTGGLLRKPAQYWDLSTVPTLLRPLLQQQALEENSYEKWIKPHLVQELRDVRRRMSNAVFKTYLLGQYKVPVPTLDTVALRYGTKVKRQGEVMMRRFLAVKDIGLRTLQKKMLWLEGWMSNQLQKLYRGLEMAL